MSSRAPSSASRSVSSAAAAAVIGLAAWMFWPGGGEDQQETPKNAETVTAPEGAIIMIPDGTIPVEVSTWSQVKSLY